MNTGRSRALEFLFWSLELFWSWLFEAWNFPYPELGTSRSALTSPVISLLSPPTLPTTPAKKSRQPWLPQDSHPTDLPYE